MQPDRFGLGDQIADGEHQPVVDQHAVAGALAAERVGGEGVGRDDGVQADHRGQRALEIVAVVLGRGCADGGTFHSSSEAIAIASSWSASIIRRIMPAREAALRMSWSVTRSDAMIPLSILDLSPVSAGSTAAQALRNSLDLARLADGLGFTRYWVAEHHNLPAIASSAPEIMIGQIAAVTTRICASARAA